MNKWMFLFLTFIALLNVWMFSREIFLNNRFLMQLFSPQILAIFVVVVTVSFATVANMILSLKRYLNGISDNSFRDKVAPAVSQFKKELIENAWLVFFSYVALWPLVFVVSWDNIEPSIQSFGYLVGVCIILLQGFAIFDIYSTMLGVADFGED